MGDWLLDPVTSGEGEEEDDEGDEGTPEEVSPADMTGPPSPSCSPVSSSFPSFGRVPSFCFLLPAASSCPAGL